MDMFVVRGGRRLRGRVRVSGAKNAALPIMAACLAVEGPVRLRDVRHETFGDDFLTRGHTVYPEKMYVDETVFSLG